MQAHPVEERSKEVVKFTATMTMNVMSNCRFPMKDEETALIEKVSEIFVETGMGSRPISLISEEFIKLLFTLNPDIFGGGLENAEKWLRECIDRAGQEREKGRTKLMKIFGRLPGEHGALTRTENHT